ncbi:MAG: phosphonate ABC transporter, permease protein PhnE [Candidatus Izimaplasma sp.]|nr:phosphonate ABC transporter, permease protein PhnE [Candidatus Izimaplasma bacterium]
MENTKNIKTPSAAVIEAFDNRPKIFIRNTIVISVLLALVIWSSRILDFGGINEQGINVIRGVMNALVKPNKDWLFNLNSNGTSIPWLMFETVSMAFLGTIIGAILSIPFAFFASRNITGEWGSYGGNIVVTTIRSFPVLILGLMFIKVAGPGPFAGVLTISVSSIGMITKLYIESIEDIDRGILDALDAMGATTIQKIRYGIIPQLTANFISVAIYRFEINVRNATILGLVGAGGIGFTLIAAMGAYRWNDAAACLWGIVVVVIVVEFFSTKIRRKLITGE